MAGVVRLERPRADAITRFARIAGAGAVGSLVGSLLANVAEQKGSAAKLGMLLGLFAGAFADAGTSRRPQRVFAMRFDPWKREWLFYSGGLRRWLNEKLLPA